MAAFDCVVIDDFRHRGGATPVAVLELHLLSQTLSDVALLQVNALEDRAGAVMPIALAREVEAPNVSMVLASEPSEIGTAIVRRLAVLPALLELKARIGRIVIVLDRVALANRDVQASLGEELDVVRRAFPESELECVVADEASEAQLRLSEPSIEVAREAWTARFTRITRELERRDRAGTSLLPDVEPAPSQAVLDMPAHRAAGRRLPRALFVTSNGAGMGHLTRMLGIARAASDCIQPVFFSMSQGVPVVRGAEFPFEYVPFTSALRTTPAAWNQYFTKRMLAAIDRYDVEMVLFDGTWPYQGLIAAAQQRGMATVWVRRGMWKSHITPEQLAKAAHFDLVIEPGDFAAAYDEGATTRVLGAERVAPISVLPASEMLSREDARVALGLPLEGGAALVTLGAGNINDVRSTQLNVLEAIAGHEDWHSVVTRAPIANDRTPAGVHSVSVFPLAKYARAFDFAVSAAGYNSFTEWCVAGLPTIWLPNMQTITDDQDARSRWAEDGGYGIRVVNESADSVHAAVERMINPRERDGFSSRLASLSPADGADEAASLLRDLVRSKLEVRRDV